MAKQGAQEIARNRKPSNIKMGAKITSQINTNQQSNMVLSAYSVVTQSCSVVNINLG